MVDMNKNIICDENLLGNGFVKRELFPGTQDYYYSKWVEHKGVKFKLDVSECSNTIGRDWNVHVDNCDCSSVGSLDVRTFGQIDALLDLLVN